MPAELTPELIDTVRSLSDDDRRRLFIETAFTEYTEEELEDELNARLDGYDAGLEPSIDGPTYIAQLKARIEAARIS